MGSSWSPTWYDWFGAIPKPKQNFFGQKEKKELPAPSQAQPKDDLKAATDAAATQAAEAQKKRQAAISRSRSIYTSPLGIQDQAQTAAKTLLGQ